MQAARAPLAFLVLLLAFSPGAAAQTGAPAPNIVLDRATEEYEFPEPKHGADLQVLCSVRQQYSCKRVNETFYYDNVFLNSSELSDFVVVVDEYRRHDLGPEYLSGVSTERYATMGICRVKLPFVAAGVKASLRSCLS